MPMLLMMLMFPCCMSVAPDAIAGEKERGTIATLLVTPMPRWHLALGKIISVSIVALLGGLCSFLGVVLSLPKLMGDSEMIDAAVYGIPEYACILGVILSTVLLFVAVISVISALAKSVKEASGMVTPLMFVILFISISGMFTGGSAPATPLMYLIPVFNSAQCISGIFSMSYEPLSVVLTMASNLVCTGVCVFALTKVFGSEKIMFNK
jgi:sodium transport system permease protein